MGGQRWVRAGPVVQGQVKPRLSWEKDIHQVSCPLRRAHARAHTGTQMSAWLSTTPPFPRACASADALTDTQRSVDAHTDAGTLRGEQAEASFHTRMALSHLGVARCGRSHTAKPHDSWGRSEGRTLNGWPGKHCSRSRMDLNFRGKGTLGLAWGYPRVHLAHQPPLSPWLSLRSLSPKPRDNC